MFRPTPLSLNQAKKMLKVAIYLALSGAISAVLVYVSDNKEMLGVYFPLVNFLLVTLKQLFTDEQ
jgi:hypothetical protein